MLVNSKVYTGSKTKNGGDPYYIVSRKIHELYKNNFKRRKKITEEKGQYEIIISAKIFFEALLWNDDYLKKNTKRQQGILIDVLDKIQEEQDISYDIISSNVKGLNVFEKFLKQSMYFIVMLFIKNIKKKDMIKRCI